MSQAAVRSTSPRSQPGILAEVPAAALMLSFELAPKADRQEVRTVLESIAFSGSSLRGAPDDDVSRDEHAHIVIGLGAPLLQLLAGTDDLAPPLPSLVGTGALMPSTPRALWCWLRGSDRGRLFHAGREFQRQLGQHFVLTDSVDAFKYREGRDLTDFVDGTENPSPGRAPAVALVADQGPGRDGSSVVTVQRWVHEFSAIDAMTVEHKESCVGRSLADDVELDEAPVSAHVKRAAQESFDPEAFLVRRSMPWRDQEHAGLCFIAFAASIDPFVAIARRMVGLEDGIVDGLFEMSRPVDGATYWCPPLLDDRLDLRALATA